MDTISNEQLENLRKLADTAAPAFDGLGGSGLKFHDYKRIAEYQKAAHPGTVRLMALELQQLRAALTPAPAQTPPPAASRCGSGGAVGAWVPVGEDGRGPGGKMTTHPDGSMSIEYPMLAIICQDMDGAPFEYGPLYGFYNPADDDWLRADGETIVWGVTHYCILPAIPPLPATPAAPTCAACATCLAAGDAPAAKVS